MSQMNELHSRGVEPSIDDSAVNPASLERTKDGRDTAAGCRERADADLANALGMSTANGRQVFEKSAASWTKRAEMLQRIETGIEARLNAPATAQTADLDAPELTGTEIAEDAAHQQL